MLNQYNIFYQICKLSDKALIMLVLHVVLTSSGFANNMPDYRAYIWAYPDWVADIGNNYLIFKDGSTMPIRTGKQNVSIMQPDLHNQLAMIYPINYDNVECNPDLPDPGRVRYDPFFQKIYGSTKEEVKSNLVPIIWLPKHINKIMLVTKINNVADKVQAISNELDILVLKSPEMLKFLQNPGGTFSWRKIAGTNRRSAHSYGMTIDINVEYASYWLWDYMQENNIKDINLLEQDIPCYDLPIYRNNIPLEIVEIFEKYHFIWGGKWYCHYDTMHFEYRPELFYYSQTALATKSVQ